MNITERHKSILHKLNQEGEVHINELTQDLGVSGVTIRKDIKFLENKSLLFRIPGGASLNDPYINERTITEKELIKPKEKKAIANAALSLLKNRESIIIGSGTTAHQFSKQLMVEKPLTVITPAVKVTLELAGKPHIKIIQLGGTIRPNSSSVAGTDAELRLENISTELLFLGADGIDLDFGISITNLEEATLNKKMIRASRKLVVLADHSKFGKRGLGKVCDISEVDIIITDDKINPKFVELLKDRGVHVLIA